MGPDRTHLIDEYTRECLALRVARRLNSLEVIDTLADVMLGRGMAERIPDSYRVKVPFNGN